MVDKIQPTERLVSIEKSDGQLRMSIGRVFLERQMGFVVLHQIFWWSLIALGIVGNHYHAIKDIWHGQPVLFALIAVGTLGLVGLFLTTRDAYTGVTYEFDQTSKMLRRNKTVMMPLDKIQAVEVRPYKDDPRLTRSPWPEVVLIREGKRPLSILNGALVVKPIPGRPQRLTGAQQDDVNSAAVEIAGFLNVPYKL